MNPSSSSSSSSSSDVSPVGIVALELQAALDEISVPFRIYENKAIRDYLYALRALLLAIPSRDVSAIVHKNIHPGLPLRNLATASSNLQFHPPNRIDIVGSYMYHTLVQPTLTIDIAVEIPKPCIHSRDIKNYIYLDKRNMYLGVLADALQGSEGNINGIISNVSVSAWYNDPSKPIITVVPTTISSSTSFSSSSSSSNLPKSLCIRIIPTLSGNVFSSKQLRPRWNNVRPWIFTNYDRPDEHTTNTVAPGTPTPVYNMTIAEDCGLLTMHCTTYAAFTAVPAAVPATIAAKAWARRRGWHRYQDHLYPSLITLIMVYLIQTNRILKIMNPLQCLRVLFTFLATNDFKKNPLVLKPIDTSLMNKFDYFSVTKTNVLSSKGIISSDDDENDNDYDDNDQLDSDDNDTDDNDMDEDNNDNISTVQGTTSVYGRLASVTNTVVQEYQAYFPAVLIGPDGITNYMARLTNDTLYEIKQEAQLASIAFAANTNTPYGTSIDPGSLLERIMGDTLYPGLRYDRILVAPIPPNPLVVQKQSIDETSVSSSSTQSMNSANKHNSLKSHSTTKGKSSDHNSHSKTSTAYITVSEKVEELYCNYTNWTHIVTHSASNVLRSALTDRVNLIRVHPVYTVSSTVATGTTSNTQTVQRWPCPDPFNWSLQSASPSPTCLWICIQINPEAGGSIANRIIDKVPSEDKVASQKFLELWGELPHGLAELRRFADGAVQYAVIWDASKLGGRNYSKHNIIPLIISHTLTRHLGISMPVSILHSGDALSFIIDKPVSTSISSSVTTTEGGGAVKGLLLADVARICPSLALERLLDTGGSTSTVTRIQVASDIQSFPSRSMTKMVEYSPLTGFPSTKRSPVQVSTASIPPLIPSPTPSTVSDPLSRGPTLAVIHAIHTLDWLSTALRSLKNMPISVASVSPIAPELRYTAIFTPSPHPLATSGSTGNSSEPSNNYDTNDALSGLLGGNRSANFEVLTAQTLVQAAMASYESYTNLVSLSVSTTLPNTPVSALQEQYDDRPESSIEGPTVCQTITPLEIIIRLETSNKWPDDPTAIAALKTAFYLKIQYGLNSLYNTNVYARAHPDWLDIFVGGYGFRAYLHIDREIAVLQSIARRPPLAKVHTKKGTSSDSSIDIVLHARSSIDGNRNTGEEEENNIDTDDNEEDDQNRARKVRGFVNIGPIGFTRAEAAPRKKARQEVSSRTGFDVTTPVSKEVLLEALHDVFGKHTTASNANSSITATAAGNRLDALYLRGVARPTHAASIHALTQRFISFGPACRLALFWLRQQRLGGEGNSLMHSSAIESPDTCLLNHGEILSSSTSTPISQEAVELIMAYIFASPAPFTVPGTPTVAFLRFLRILGHHDWLREPLLVDLESCIHHDTTNKSNSTSIISSSSSTGLNVINNEGMVQPNDYRTLFARFRETRQSSSNGNNLGSNYIAYPPVDDHLPNGAAMYIVTPRERGIWKPIWTRYSPSWSILQTIVQNARTTESKLVSSLLPIIPPYETTSDENNNAPKFPTVYFGTAEGTTIESLYHASNQTFTDIPLLSNDAGSSVDKYDVIVQTKGLSLLPRVSLDGRNYGPIKDPYECAAYLAQNPSLLVEKVQQTLQIYQPLVQEKNNKTKVEDKSIPKVNIPLIVPEAEEDQTIMGSKHDSLPSQHSSSSLSTTAAAKLTIVLPFPYYRDYGTMQLQVYKNLLHQSRNALLNGFDPYLCYLRTLRYQFGQYANFFINLSRPESIGIQWRPGTFKLPIGKNHEQSVPSTISSISSTITKGKRKNEAVSSKQGSTNSPVISPLYFSQITVQINTDTLECTSGSSSSGTNGTRQGNKNTTTMISSSANSSSSSSTSYDETSGLSTIFLSRILPLIESINESGAGLVKQTKLQREKGTSNKSLGKK